MPDVLGLDLGLAHAGAASITDRGSVATWVLHTAAPEQPSLDDTIARLDRVTRWSLSFVTTGTVLAVVEAPSFGSEHGQQHERAAIHWRVVAGLRRRAVPVALAAPTTLKKWATGNGHADKHAMRRAVSALWPSRGLHRVTEHEIDALTAAGAGAHCWCEWPGPWLGPSPSALASITWPEKP